MCSPALADSPPFFHEAATAVALLLCRNGVQVACTGVVSTGQADARSLFPAYV